MTCRGVEGEPTDVRADVEQRSTGRQCINPVERLRLDFGPVLEDAVVTVIIDEQPEPRTAYDSRADALSLAQHG